MVGSVAPVRAVPGRSRDGTRCRRCLNEIETLPHILGFCPYSEAVHNIRHHAVRSMLAEALKEVGFTVHQEVQGLATQGSVRRIDIIAIKNNSAYILDPTIRFETHADQPHEVDSEKKRIYEPTIPFYKDKYSLSHIDVIGLMVGARDCTETSKSSTASYEIGDWVVVTYDGIHYPGEVTAVGINYVEVMITMAVVERYADEKEATITYRSVNYDGDTAMVRRTN
ncbi:hypothetical protein ANN_09665 [Periplaneta americana]|uniref:Uncharacterized protein n=1 Tax=Periplaneta americana TaxID=6978 RepID=A0ABQ8TLX6_PERAM|nr:hypothetical protein ANN_09665 [Periplaneta americana]